METMFYYSLPSSDACVVFSQIKTPQEELNINKDSNISSSLPLLSIRFHLRAVELCWYKPPHGDPQQLQYHRPMFAKSRHLEYYPSIYASYDLFYNVLQENMENLGEEFEDNYRRDIICYIIGEVRDIFYDESNKGREKVEVSIDTIFVVKRFLDKSILDDHCVICFEEPGKEGEVMCTPCSHVFHEDCIAKWLEHGNSCPICRHDILDS
ncbi:hypothetical protein H5410_059434 [Solanum commersonii]|uniref:RING-type domain-containing protein n=1 Tax=Solanum commersonii TaxID=4109 RepID=A0A9J5W2Y0_SOLCO|nr:hypothetical protein H5410_059434 [Solanum commersonii]